MAAHDESLDRVQSPTVVAQPVSIGPRQAENKKEDARKGKKHRRRPRPSIEETLRQEQTQRECDGDEEQTHIDYHA